jgi:hypothetical protein
MSLSQAACKKTVCVIDHKLLHDASFTMVNVLDGSCFTAKCQHCVTHMAVMNCCRIVGVIYIKPMMVKMSQNLTYPKMTEVCCKRVCNSENMYLVITIL